jgi:hypothetical protein
MSDSRRRCRGLAGELGSPDTTPGHRRERRGARMYHTDGRRDLQETGVAHRLDRSERVQRSFSRRNPHRVGGTKPATGMPNASVLKPCSLMPKAEASTCTRATSRTQNVWLD